MTLNKLSIALGISLFLSLSANLFLGGMLLGKTVSRSDGKGRAEWEKKDEQLRQALSGDDRKVLQEAMRGSREKFKALREELEAARKSVTEAMSAVPSDQAVLDEFLRIEKEKKAELLRLMQQTRQEALQRLSPEGRDALQKMGGFRRGDFFKGPRNDRQDQLLQP